MLTRRGFTLVELLVAIVVFALVGGAVAGLLVATARRVVAARGLLGREEAIRTAVRVLRHDLEPLVPLAGELAVDGDSALRVAALRGSGVVCAIGASDVTVRAWASVRGAVAGRDELLVFADGDEATAGDDAWVRQPIAGAAASSCPDGRPAQRLGVAGPVPPGVRIGAPLLLREPLEYRRYRSASRAWLGARAVATGEVIQPVAGPYASVSGLVFAPLDAVRGVAAPADAWQVGIVVRAEEGGGRDSLAATFGLRGAAW